MLLVVYVADHEIQKEQRENKDKQTKGKYHVEVLGALTRLLSILHRPLSQSIRWRTGGKRIQILLLADN